MKKDDLIYIEVNEYVSLPFGDEGCPVVLDTEMKKVRLKHATIKQTTRGCAVILPNGGGRMNFNAIDQDPLYHVIAARCGYDNQLEQYCFECFFCHFFLCERLSHSTSRVVESIVNGVDIALGEMVFEKMSVQMFQRWLRANERPNALPAVDWDYLKAEALMLLEGEHGHPSDSLDMRTDNGRGPFGAAHRTE